MDGRTDRQTDRQRETEEICQSVDLTSLSSRFCIIQQEVLQDSALHIMSHVAREGGEGGSKEGEKGCGGREMRRGRKG